MACGGYECRADVVEIVSAARRLVEAMNNPFGDFAAAQAMQELEDAVHALPSNYEGQ